MTIEPMASADVVRIGQDIYARDLQTKLDTPENQGRLVALDIKSGDYEMGRDSLEVSDTLIARRPDAHVYLLRIGRRTAVSMGGWNDNGKR
ncbi:MAG: hypothetical protein H7Y38_15330 [Armatimonadetes bacterium]|nr:hypothetical protein [Armatimonadota bacterium]